MNILISGCSFTQWPEYPGGPNVCWPGYLRQSNDNFQIVNIAEAGAGNQYICDSVIRSVLEKTPDLILVMWTGVSRLDYLTSLEDPAWAALYDSYGFYRRVAPGDRLGYIFSGGESGTWCKNLVARQIFKDLYKVSSPLSLATINLQEIVKLQSFLKLKHIPYRFMSYVNYWSQESIISPNGDFGVLSYPELNYLIKEIDFNPWIFSNDQRDGIYEMAKSNTDFTDDKFHPGEITHRQWAALVRENFLG